MTLRLPKDARKAPDAKPWEELQKHANELFWGDRECSGPPAAGVTPFRGVVVIGCVLAQRNDLAGELVLRTGGVFTFDDKQPEVARALAEQLRETADRLEREAGS